MPNIKLKNQSGNDVTYNNVNKIIVPNSDGGTTEYSSGGGAIETCTLHNNSGVDVAIFYIDVNGQIQIKDENHKPYLLSGESLQMAKLPFIVTPVSIDYNIYYSTGGFGYVECMADYDSWVEYVVYGNLDRGTSALMQIPTELDLYIYPPECFLPDTLITLSDGSYKLAKDITYEDKLLVWDFDEGNFSQSDICWITKKHLKNGHYYRLTFSNGTILETTGNRSNHKIYDVDKRKFVGVAYMEIGDRIFSENGIVTITNKEYIEEECEYYNLITSGNINCFCNGILASNRYGNMYPIDENMKYIKDGRQIRPYSEFEPHKIKKYWYDNLRLGELTDDINDVINYIGKLECQMDTSIWENQ